MTRAAITVRAAGTPEKYPDFVRRFRVAIALATVVVVATALIAVSATAAPQSPSSGHGVTSITLTSAKYKPVSQGGSTDDYHCTLLNPHVTRDSYVISSQFLPGSPEDHHAALFLVPPSLAATAEQDNVGNKGWTCFGEAGLPNLPIDDILSTPFLSVWAPGHGVDDLPQGTGIELPAGSLVIMQVHYNLLVGDKAVKNSLVLHTVPTSTSLQPLKLNLMFAPPDIPCPSGVTGQLCNRPASLANQGQRFGESAVTFVNIIEQVCGHNPSNPPAGDSATCTWPITNGGYIVRVQAHMHLLGQSFSMVLDPGTPQAKTILDVPDYNFHYQKAYNLSSPIAVTSGEKVQVTCSYDPTRAQELPILRKAPTHFVTWGDGSSDEMCLGLAWTSSTIPKPHNPV